MKQYKYLKKIQKYEIIVLLNLGLFTFHVNFVYTGTILVKNKNNNNKYLRYMEVQCGEKVQKLFAHLEYID